MVRVIFFFVCFFVWSFLFLLLARKWPMREKLLRTVAGLPLVPFVVPFFMWLFESRDNPLTFTMNVIVILLWTLFFVKMVRGKEDPVGCLSVLTVLFVLFIGTDGFFAGFFSPFIPQYRHLYTVEAHYRAEALPPVGYIRSQIDLYQYENARLPFENAEVGTVTTWQKTDDGRYEPIQLFSLKADVDGEPVDGAVGADRRAARAEAALLPATNNIFSRLEMPPNELNGKRISPDQIQLACLAPGGVSEDGATTNTHAYAVGVFGMFGSWDRGLARGTGYAVLDAFFPVVVTTNGTGAVETGYRLVATWKDYHKGETPIRFGYAGESGALDKAVCPLIPPEAFAPGAVIKLHGNGPDSVEYWAKRLSDAPCGRWEYSLP